MFHNGTAPAFDTFSMSRSMEKFFYDLYDEPELIKKACAAATPEIIKTALKCAKKGDRIAVYAMRSSATSVSPQMGTGFRCSPTFSRLPKKAVLLSWTGIQTSVKQRKFLAVISASAEIYQDLFLPS